MKQLKKVLVPIFAISILFLQLLPIHATTKDWYEVKGTYAKDDNSQYNNAILSLMYLDNDVVMFEFFVMEGSESEDTSNSFCLPGAFYVDENGIGIYNHPKTGDVTITFELNESGVSVNQSGNLKFNVSGQYEFVEDYIKVTEEAAIEILEQLPPATTSLNQYNKGSKLVMSEEMVDGWFYDVKAYLEGSVIAEFYIAADMSAVYRVDTDVPILIWGSAQPLLDSTYLADRESVYGTTSDENSANVDNENKGENGSEEDTLVEVNYVSVYPENASISIGNTTQTIVTVPGMLEYTLKCDSSDTEIVKIDDEGIITAVSEGEALISGIIAIDGAEKTFEFTVYAFDENAVVANEVDQGKSNQENSNQESSNGVWFVTLGGIIIVLAVSLILVKKKRPQHKN